MWWSKAQSEAHIRDIRAGHVVTSQMLRQLEACRGEVYEFSLLFESAARFTLKNLRTAALSGLSVSWLAKRWVSYQEDAAHRAFLFDELLLAIEKFDYASLMMPPGPEQRNFREMCLAKWLWDAVKTEHRGREAQA